MPFMEGARRAREYVAEARVRLRRSIDTFGIVQGRKRRLRDDFSVLVPFHYAESVDRSTPLRVAALCHIFYTDMAPDIYTALENIAFPVDIVITTDTEEKSKYLNEFFFSWPKGKVRVEVVENRGRDVYPRLYMLRKIINGYDLFLFLHSKKTPYIGHKGGDWQRYLFTSLAGSKSTTLSILDAFERDPALGLVFPQHKHWLRWWVQWEYSFSQARDLGRRMGFHLDRKQLIEFPAGSMFWARADAIRPLIDLGLTVEEFAPEQAQASGTLAHTVERIFCYTVEAAGYYWIKVSPSGFIEEPSTVVEIATPEDLSRFVQRHVVRLLGGARRP